ncbi:Xaa-Pro dipeptidase [Holophaga foetida]|uniref:Xaa-Pro dipeptidase n=1 Tax=Holophaga foetida TaxID=35839 RepID=UPI0002474A07|nr:Xaa-Pro dipeptidase [Holophaga foetida]
MSLTALFHDHLSERMHWVATALSATRFDTLIISSGEPFTYFADDQEAPFNTTPHFRHYCPLEGPHHVLKLQPGRKPQLIRYAPEDFWYEQLPLGNPFWLNDFDLVEAPTVDAVWEAVGKPMRGAYVGNELVRATGAELELNPSSLMSYLDWGRALKTPYEVACTEEATILGAKGHEAGRKAFLAGASELEIHYAFVQAVGCLDHELAFPSIVALDEKSATLHYEKKRGFRKGRVLLLDCGARHLGYPSDITRTTVKDSCDTRFQALRNGVEKLERELCDEVIAGRPWGQVHHLSHLKIGALLQEAGILKVDAEEAVAKGFTRPFFPHGLGHFLGIQVHDVAGKLASPDGSVQPAPPAHPYLRTTQTLTPGHLITVEPGLYFIPMLLRPFREGDNASRFDWKQIDELTPLGGIRIEDNVLVTQDGPRNLTRKHLPD